MTNDMNKDKYALRVVRSPATRTGADWRLERASDKVEASLRLLHWVRSMVDTSRWWMTKRPVAVVVSLTTAMDATPDEGHKSVRRLRAITVKHMGDL